MKKFTLDTNCIIDLEENRPNSQYIRQILQAWQAGEIELAVVAISASEKQRGGIYAKTYDDFRKKLAAVGLAGVTELLPKAYWNVSYWNRALWTDKEEKLEGQIWGLLFPGVILKPPTMEEDVPRWRNKLCDVMVAWSHAYHGCEVLITSDKNFHSKRDGLANLGVNVMSPQDTVELVRMRRSGCAK
jgi:hypothetical protein